MYAKIIILLLLVCIPVQAQAPSAQDLRQLQEASVMRPFLDSPDYKTEPQSIDRFFSAEVYSLLKGNSYFGYLYDEGFQPVNQHIRVDTIQAISQTQIHLAAFRRVFARVLPKTSLILDDSAITRIGVCLVGVQPVATRRTVAGVCLEVYISNAQTRKSLYHRLYIGSAKGLPDAMIQSCAVIFAHISRKLP